MELNQLSLVGEKTADSLKSLFSLLITIGVASIGFIVTIRHYYNGQTFPILPYYCGLVGFLGTILMAVLGQITLTARISALEVPRIRTHRRTALFLIRHRCYRSLCAYQLVGRMFTCLRCRRVLTYIKRALYSPYFWFYAAWVGFALGITSFMFVTLPG